MVLGGHAVEGSGTLRGVRDAASAEILKGDSIKLAERDSFQTLPPLSCGPIFESAVVEIDESESDQGQVLLIGGHGLGVASPALRKVDLATGVCTAQPSLICPDRYRIEDCTAGRLPNGRIVCTGVTFLTLPHEKYSDEEVETYFTMAQVLEPPPYGSPGDGAWQWRSLPGTIVRHSDGGAGSVLSDGRFAVFGGLKNERTPTSSCEALTFDADGRARWEFLTPKLRRRLGFACVAISGCVIIAGGEPSNTVEVYEEGLGRWRKLPCNISHDSQRHGIGSALT